MKVALQFEKVSYKYPGTKNWVLEDISLKIPQGSFFVIIGPSGSGKTTLVSLARGFAQEWGGELKGKIFVDGEDIKKKNIAELGKKIGLIFQNPALQLHQLRVIDEVMSAPMYQGLPFEECQKRARTLVNKILGKKFYYRSPSELSSGEQQKTALAASLSMRADILLLDEPLSFLDTKADQEVLKIILNLHREGKTVVIATHDIEEVARYATQMALLDKGKLILEGKPEEVLYSPKLEEILTTPLSVKTAKALIKKNKLKEKVVSWQDLLDRTNFKQARKKKQIKKKEETILNLENVFYSYPGTREGVKDINLKLNKNEILGIVGANGSGKTTLAKLILGLLKPKKGKIKLAGKDITKLSTFERAKKIGYVTQDPMDMFFEVNILDEVAAGPKFLKLSEPKKRAERILKELNLWQYREKHPDSISGGEKSLLGIGDILVNEPEILLLDEPEFGLDPKNWRKITGIIEDLRGKGKTIIVITQDLEITTFLCDRIVLMKDGEILRQGTPQEVFTNFNLLKRAHLNPLPMFNFLNYVSGNVLDSEEKFIKELTK
jgi:energy-coupling factor transport system ATP-binding protein